MQLDGTRTTSLLQEWQMQQQVSWKLDLEVKVVVKLVTTIMTFF